MAAKDITLAPLTAVLDTRSAPNLMGATALRMRQNLQTTGDNKLRRGTGFRKLGHTTSNYNNADLHDQLLHFTDTIRQPITMARSVVSTRDTKHLLVATQRTVFKLNEYSGNYSVLGTGYGGTASTSANAPRFCCAQHGDYVLLTNDFETPMYHTLEQGPTEEVEALIKEIPDAAAIGLTRAARVWVWRNVTFFADVEMDGERFPNRLLWSDYDNPISLDPAKVESIAGMKDLNTGERILGGEPFGNSFIIYTTGGIWEMVVVGGERSFDFIQRYGLNKDQKTGLLKYPNTLVALPDEHVYLSEDGVYTYTPHMVKPERVEWIHRSSSLIMDDIDVQACEVHVAGLHGEEVLISTARVGDLYQCPSRTLRINTKYRVVDFMDVGFTVFCSHPSDTAPTVRDWIVAHNICTLEGLAAEGYPYDNEGLPRVLPEGEAAFTPTAIHTNTPYTDGGITVEDYRIAESDADSICALLDGATLDDTCRKCAPVPWMVAAWSTDWCLKELGGVFYREECVNPTNIGSADATGYKASIGNYLLNGYTSLIRFAPMWQDAKGKTLVELEGIELLAQPAVEASPNSIGLRIGISAEPVDSNEALANIVWYQHSQQLLKANTTRTPTQHAANNSIPVDPISWNLYRRGRCLHVELRIAGTAGDVVLSGITVSAEAANAKL